MQSTQMQYWGCQRLEGHRIHQVRCLTSEEPAHARASTPDLEANQVLRLGGLHQRGLLDGWIDRDRCDPHQQRALHLYLHRVSLSHFFLWHSHAQWPDLPQNLHSSLSITFFILVTATGG
jgi:hypothetical protein